LLGLAASLANSGVIHIGLDALSPGWNDDAVCVDDGDQNAACDHTKNKYVSPVQPSPFDIWAAEDVEEIIDECTAIKPNLLTRFLVNRLILNTTLGNEVQEELGKRRFPTFHTAIRNRQEYAKAARHGMTALETEPHGPAADEIHAWKAETIDALNQSHQVSEEPFSVAANG
jgi:cellulose biosynthesis protein BcsQ